MERATLSLGAPSRRGEHEGDRFPYVGSLDHYGGGIPFAGTPAESDTVLALIQTEVRSHLDQLNQCYLDRLRLRPELTGKVVMHWSVGTDGKVVEQCVTEDSVGDVELRACVNQLVATVQLSPPPSAPVSVTFPFVFSPKP